MSKHTPGPGICKVQEGKHGRVYVASMNGQNVIDAGAVSVADARLIAAAPELFAVLIAIANLETPEPHTVEHMRDLACAAISKATGE